MEKQHNQKAHPTMAEEPTKRPTPRAAGTNERTTARNKWALRNWKRAQKAAANAQPEPVKTEPTWADRMSEWERALRAKAKPKPASTDPEWTRAIRAWKAKAKTMEGPSA